MSEFENTNLPFLEQDCIEFFGEEQGQNVFGKTLEIYRELTRKGDYRNNDAIKYHMTVKLFPEAKGVCLNTEFYCWQSFLRTAFLFVVVFPALFCTL